MYAELDIRDSKGNKERTKHKIQEEKFKKISPLLERERNLDTEHIGHMKDLFLELSSLRRPNQVIESLDPVRLESHIRQSGIKITKWEYNLVMDMDLIFRSAIMDRR